MADTEESTGGTDPLLAEADALYALAPGEFTGARDARAVEVKAVDPALSARIRKLRRPTVAAWLVNLLVRREAEQIDQVLVVGAALRDAADALDAAQLREMTVQRRQLTAAMSTRARVLGREEGVVVSGSVADQVESTLTAAMIEAGAARAVRSGLLVTALSSTGLDPTDLSRSLAAPEALGFTATPRVPAPIRPELHVVRDPEADARERADARTRVDEAGEVVDRVAGELDGAEREVRDLEARSMQVQAELDELRAALDLVQARAEAVEEELAEAEETRASVARELAAARREQELAQKAWQRLS